MVFRKVMLCAALLAPVLLLAMATSQTAFSNRVGPSLAARAVHRLEHEIGSSFFAYPDGAWYHPESNPGGIINLATAENSILSNRLIRDIHARFKLTPDHLKYRDALIRSSNNSTLDALPVFLNRSLRPVRQLTSDVVVPGPGIGAMLAQLIWALCDEGEGVLLTTPFYTDYLRDIIYPARAELVPAHVPADVDSLSLDVIPFVQDTIEKSISTANPVRVLLVCNPHNPLGRVYPVEVLVAYAQLAEKYDLHLIVDEVFANQVFDSKHAQPAIFTSILAIPHLTASPQRIHVFAGPTKDLGASGLKVGALVTYNQDVRTLIRSALAALPVSSASDAALTPLMLDEEWMDGFLDENRRVLGRAFDTVADWCVEHEIEFIPAEAGVFFLVDLAPFIERLPGDSAAERLEVFRLKIIGSGVYIRPTTASLDPKPYRFRFVFSHPQFTLKLALRRLETALGLAPSQVARE